MNHYYRVFHNFKEIEIYEKKSHALFGIFDFKNRGYKNLTILYY